MIEELNPMNRVFATGVNDVDRATHELAWLNTEKELNTNPSLGFRQIDLDFDKLTQVTRRWYLT